MRKLPFARSIRRSEKGGGTPWDIGPLNEEQRREFNREKIKFFVSKEDELKFEDKDRKRKKKAQE